MASADLEAWVNTLRSKNMPARDPNLTSHVLKVSNSVHYNYSSQKINTISRAIVLIGLKGIRAISISLLVLDRLLSGQPKERVLELIALGFHSATQAQSLLNSSDHSDQEEVFIAGLLYNLGEMSFWLSDDAENNPDLLSANPIIRKQAMDEIIGGSFKELSAELAKHWKLGEVLEEALAPSDNPSAKAKAVVVGERLGRASLFGWESPQFKKVLAEAAEFTEQSLEQTLKQVKASADKASVVAVNYGAPQVCPMIPNSVEQGYFQKDTAKKSLQPDPQVQLSILRELSCAAKDKIDVNTILQKVLEGMHRGVGLERVVIGFISGHKVTAKYTLGEGVDHWRKGFNFDIGPYTDNIFTYTLEHGGAMWFDKQKVEAIPENYPDDVVRVVGRQPSLVFVLRVGTRNAAIFYADRGNSGATINQEHFDSFKHFADQAQMNLNQISQKQD